MLELYFGNDTIAVRQKAIARFDVLVEQGFRPERVEALDLTSDKIAEIAGSVSLFGEKTVFLLESPSEAADLIDGFYKALPELAATENAVIVIEGPLLAPAKKKWQAAAVVEECTKPAAARFDSFKMAEALSLKDKKSLWVLLQEARREGLSSEEIIGTLWWQLKTLRLVLVTSSAEEAGMKSYPYDKAKRAVRNFKLGELEAISRRLLKVYHDGHGGVKDIEVGLEEWVLTI